MLTQRSEGLRRLLLICQIWITAGLFWLGVWVMVKFYSPPRGTDLAPLQHLSRVACAGIDPGVFDASSSRAYPLQLISCGSSGNQEKFVMVS